MWCAATRRKPNSWTWTTLAFWPISTTPRHTASLPEPRYEAAPAPDSEDSWRGRTAAAAGRHRGAVFYGGKIRQAAKGVARACAGPARRPAGRTLQRVQGP